MSLLHSQAPDENSNRDQVGNVNESSAGVRTTASLKVAHTHLLAAPSSSDRKPLLASRRMGVGAVFNHRLLLLLIDTVRKGLRGVESMRPLWMGWEQGASPGQPLVTTWGSGVQDDVGSHLVFLEEKW